MAELGFDPEADAALAALEADPSRRELLARISAVLDQLESDPGDATVRRLRFHRPALWCVPVVSHDEEWAILWEPHPTEPDIIVVQYVGPASFA